jgi:uncharacterized protein
MTDYYVYAYIDPRNLEEFYYGKGRGSRKYAHLSDGSTTAKTQRIAAIRSEGLEPLVRVYVRDLSEREAFLIEKTLLWKLGKLTTNVATGAFADNFRPHDNLHKELSGFDFQNSIYYYNVGEGQHRNWDDYTDYSFIAAGQGPRWRNAMLGFKPGDIVCAYLKKHGYVGIGRILTPASMANSVLIESKPLLSLSLKCPGLADNAGDQLNSEYVCKVKWLASVSRIEAKWQSSPKLFTSQLVRASLDGQPTTVDFLAKEFDVDIRAEAA